MVVVRSSARRCHTRDGSDPPFRIQTRTRIGRGTDMIQNHLGARNFRGVFQQGIRIRFLIIEYSIYI